MCKGTRIAISGVLALSALLAAGAVLAGQPGGGSSRPNFGVSPSVNSGPCAPAGCPDYGRGGGYGDRGYPRGGDWGRGGRRGPDYGYDGYRGQRGYRGYGRCGEGRGYDPEAGQGGGWDEIRGNDALQIPELDRSSRRQGPASGNSRR